MAIKLEG